MKYLVRSLKSLLPKKIQKPLGRWQTETCMVQMNNKIDLSNEDHCGPCGQYALAKIDSKNKKK